MFALLKRQDGSSVGVNPALVRYVERYGKNGTLTRIGFTNEDEVIVHGSFSATMTALNSSGVRG